MLKKTNTSKSDALLDPKRSIIIKGARLHNLKNVDVSIPRNQLVVVTGVSGSGKSSLTIDTLYAEGQRRYVESLSSYARQFLSRMNKPEVEYIKGICPAIAIEQRTSGRNTRSTVGTMTEIFDYLRLLFARIGKTYSPVSGELVKKDSVTDIVNYILFQNEEEKIQVLAPIVLDEELGLEKIIDIILQKGFSRVRINNEVHRIGKLDTSALGKINSLEIVIDRVQSNKDEDNQNRIADSVATALAEGHGKCIIEIIGKSSKSFSNIFERDGIVFEIPNPQFFNFNNSYGACKKCEGFGSVIGIDESLVIPNQNLSVYDNAIAPWRSEKMSAWKNKLLEVAHELNFPVHTPVKELSEKNFQLLWTGNKYFEGLNQFFIELEENAYKIQYRVMLARYRGKTKCPDCKGSRIRKDARNVKIGDWSITDLMNIPLDEIKTFFDQLELSPGELKISKRLKIELEQRVNVLCELGLGYLTLNRRANTLSGGETQRIQLTRILGSNLTNSLYILDEPSIGLHPRDTGRLIKVLRRLRDLKNTVVVVEHEEDVIRSADYLIDMGPEAGRFGGEVVFAGASADIQNEKEISLTAGYLSGERKIEIPKHRRKPFHFIDIKGADKFNLKNIDVRIPLQTFTVVSGVSGSGKTTLIKEIFFKEMQRYVDGFIDKNDTTILSGDLDHINQLEMIDQNPLGRSSRSNPVTYIKAYDHIRALFAGQKLAKMRGYQAKHFSFNVDGGRCDECKGEGTVTIEMQFLADINLECEVCKGKRFKKEVLEVQYKGKNIADILDMSVEESLVFFINTKDLYSKLEPLNSVGLGYVKLGQSSSTLSGGEAQRVKLASFLSKGKTANKVLFVFDEPTTGLHFHDIQKLLKAFYALVELGHTIIVIEHNMDVIKCADWVIDLGPDGGKHGGYLLYSGKPEGMQKVKKSHTAEYLKNKLNE